MLNILTLSKPGEPSREVQPAALPPLLNAPEMVIWIRCLTPTDADLTWLQETFALHPLTIEDCRQRNQRPKLEPYDGYLFMVLFALAWAGDEVEINEVHCFLARRYFITVEDRDSPPLAAVWQRMHATPSLLEQGADFAFYAVADAIVDTYFALLETLEDRLDDIEERVFAPRPAAIQPLIFRRRTALITIRRAIGPMRDVFNALLNRNLPVIREAHLPYFRDLYDHSVRIYELLETARERLSNALEVHLTYISNTLNQVMKRLTAIATIFMPLTFLTGFFGMNFELLPFRSPVTLGLAVGSMVVIPAAMWLWMRRADWF